jgi:hypothetical protein
VESYLIVGGFLFWLYIAIVSALLFVSVFNEALIASMVIGVFAIMVALFVFDAPLEKVTPRTLWGWLLLVTGYLSIGAIWSFFKFRCEYAEECRRGFSSRFDRELDCQAFLEKHGPSVSDFHERIIGWIAWWPISVAIYCLFDLLMHLCERVYELLSGIYEGIAKRVRSSVAASLEKKGR